MYTQDKKLVKVAQRWSSRCLGPVALGHSLHPASVTRKESGAASLDACFRGMSIKARLTLNHQKILQCVLLSSYSIIDCIDYRFSSVRPSIHSYLDAFCFSGLHITLQVGASDHQLHFENLPCMMQMY